MGRSYGAKNIIVIESIFALDLFKNHYAPPPLLCVVRWVMWQDHQQLGVNVAST